MLTFFVRYALQIRRRHRRRSRRSGASATGAAAGAADRTAAAVAPLRQPSAAAVSQQSDVVSGEVVGKNDVNVDGQLINAPCHTVSSHRSRCAWRRRRWCRCGASVCWVGFHWDPLIEFKPTNFRLICRSVRLRAATADAATEIMTVSRCPAATAAAASSDELLRCANPTNPTLFHSHTASDRINRPKPNTHPHTQANNQHKPTPTPLKSKQTKCY